MANNKGSAKYDNLQLDWFQNSTKYLSTNESKILISEDVIDKKHFKSCVVSNIHTIVFAVCCSEIIDFLKEKRGKLDEGQQKDVEHLADEDFTLFKSHGWVLCEMKKHLNVKLSDDEQIIWTEVQQNLVCKDKAKLPPKLLHVDKGLHDGMTFPTQDLLPFMRLADVTFKRCACSENQLNFGKNIASIIKLQMHSHVGLKGEFGRVISESCHISSVISDKIYDFWIEKYCNMRIKDSILIGSDKLELYNKNKKSSNTENLRDKLFTKTTKE